MVTVTSFNLRTIAVAIGPVLPSIQDELGMSQTMGGLLTSLPTLCFALFGFLAGRISGLLGLHRAILVALIVNIGGQNLPAMSATPRSVSCWPPVWPPTFGAHQPATASAGQTSFPGAQRTGHLALHDRPVDRPDYLASLYTAPLAISLELARRLLGLGLRLPSRCR